MSSGKWRPFCRSLNVLSNYKEYAEPLLVFGFYASYILQLIEHSLFRKLIISRIWGLLTMPYITSLDNISTGGAAFTNMV